jgi:hypothetical protein
MNTVDFISVEEFKEIWAGISETVDIIHSLIIFNGEYDISYTHPAFPNERYTLIFKTTYVPGIEEELMPISRETVESYSQKGKEVSAFNPGFLDDKGKMIRLYKWEGEGEQISIPHIANPLWQFFVQKICMEKK